MFDSQKELSLDSIRLDGGTQCRLKIDVKMVRDYADFMSDGVVFPPLVVFFDGAEYWLADGFHRYHAAKKIKRTVFNCNIVNGTVRDAILYSFGANGSHGLPLSNADKRSIVVRMLGDDEWKQLSDREIGRRCKVSHMLVRKIRAELKIENKRTRGPNKTEDKPVRNDKPEARVVEAPADPVNDKSEEIAELEEKIAALVEENESLSFQLATNSADDPDFAAKTIQELRDENIQLRLEVKALTVSRDQFQAENAQLIKQVNYLSKQLKKLDVAQVTDGNGKAA